MGLVFPEEMFVSQMYCEIFIPLESNMSVFLYKLDINHRASNIITNLGFLSFGVPQVFPCFFLINYVFIQQECIKLIKNDSKGICIVALHCICIVKKIKKSDNKLLRTAMILTLMNSFLYYIILVLFIFLDFVLDIHTTRCSIMHIYRI